MNLLDIVLVVFVFMAFFVVLSVWLGDLMKWLHMRSEESRTAFVRELCRSIRHDKAWKRKGNRLSRHEIIIEMRTADDNTNFRVVEPFKADYHEFCPEDHELVRYAVNARDQEEKTSASDAKA